MEIEVRTTEVFLDWLRGLADEKAKRRIVQRIIRLQGGNLGDAKSLGDKVSELRIDYGPGYRLYFTRQGRSLVILLCGGDKQAQSRDIAKAKMMAKDLE